MGSTQNKNSNLHINSATPLTEPHGMRCPSVQMANSLLGAPPTPPHTRSTFGTLQMTVSLRAPWMAAGNPLSMFMYANPMICIPDDLTYACSGTRASRQSFRLQIMATFSSGTARRLNDGVLSQVALRKSMRTSSTGNVRMNSIS
jgi:hypothetical protein